MTPRWKAALLAGALAAAGTLAFVLLRDGGEAASDRGPVIARVDGTPIHLAEARTRVQGVATVHDEGGLGPEWADRILQSLIDDVIIGAEARSRGIEPGEEEIEEGMSSIRTDFATEAEFEEWLEQQDMDLPELRRRVTLDLLTSRVYLAVTADVRVTDEAIRNYYRSHRSEYVVDDRRIPLLEVREDIRQMLEKRDSDRAFDEWLTDGREGARVVVLMQDWWERL